MSISKSNTFVSAMDKKVPKSTNTVTFYCRACFSALCWSENYQLTIVLPLQLLFNYWKQLTTLTTKLRITAQVRKQGHFVTYCQLLSATEILEPKAWRKPVVHNLKLLFYQHSKPYNFVAGRQFQSVSKWTLAFSRQTSWAQSGSTSGNLSRWQTIWWQTIWK